MSTARDITSYGGPFEDAYAVEDPTIEQSSAFDNIALEDEAQMTRTTVKAKVRFATSTSAAPLTIAALTGTSHMGTGYAQLPVVAKIGVGLYTVTYPSSWQDALGATEAISFTYSDGCVESLSAYGIVQTTTLGSVISLATFNAAGTVADLADGTVIKVEAA